MGVYFIWGMVPLLGLLAPLVALALFIFLTIRATRLGRETLCRSGEHRMPHCHRAILFDLTDQHGGAAATSRHVLFRLRQGLQIVEVTDMPAIPGFKESPEERHNRSFRRRRVCAGPGRFVKVRDMKARRRYAFGWLILCWFILSACASDELAHTTGVICRWRRPAPTE
jgi:hypothetical protein